ncbi:hypothetical protein [Azospirillum endophyticum]
MPQRQDTATVSAIRQIRGHSRECQSLSAREVLLRIERRMIEFLEYAPALPVQDPWADQERLSQSNSGADEVNARL